MERTVVSSSMIQSIGYDAENQTLELEFMKGVTWQYFGVPQAEHDALMASDSKGKYFLANIKKRYTESKV